MVTCLQAARVSSFSELAIQTIADLGERDNLGIVCGPITTGGTGIRESNLLIFNAVVQTLLQKGFDLFNQMPYEDEIALLAQEWRAKRSVAEYCTPILTEYYAKIFATGKIVRAFFLPGWWSSDGARWEHREFVRSGRYTYYLRRAEIKRCLEECVPEHAQDMMRSYV